MARRNAARLRSLSAPRLRLTSGVSEHDIQAALFQWAALMVRQYPELDTLYAIPNGAKYAGTPRERAIHAARMRAEGLRAGMLDVCLPVRSPYYGALYIEHKSETGRLEPEQKAWRERLVAVGNRVIVSRSFEESRAAIVEYLASVRQGREANA